MTSSRRLDIAADARKDIRGMLRVTTKAWGEPQRVRYGQQITNAMNQLTRFPDLGMRIEPDIAGIRALPVGQHIIYYLVHDRSIRVLRVLHVRMDAAAHLRA